MQDRQLLSQRMSLSELKLKEKQKIALCSALICVRVHVGLFAI